MLQRIIDNPWIFIAMIVTMAALCVAAFLRVQRDKLRSGRAKVDRRETPRTDPDRRWEKRKNKKTKR